MKKAKKTNDYQKLLKTSSANCRNETPASKKRLKNAVARYKTNAKAKGKTSAEIQKIVSRATKCRVGK